MTYHRPIMPNKWWWRALDLYARQVCQALVGAERSAEEAANILGYPMENMDVIFLGDDKRLPVVAESVNPGFVGRRWRHVDDKGSKPISSCSAVTLAYDKLNGVVHKLSCGREGVFSLCTHTGVFSSHACILCHGVCIQGAPNLIEVYRYTSALSAKATTVKRRCNSLRQCMQALLFTIDADRRTLDSAREAVTDIARAYAELWELALWLPAQVQRQYCACKKVRDMLEQYLREKAHAE